MGWIMLCGTLKRSSSTGYYTADMRGGRTNEDIFQGRHCSRRVSRNIDLQMGCVPSSAPAPVLPQLIRVIEEGLYSSHS